MTFSDPLQIFGTLHRTSVLQRVQSVTMAEQTHSERRKADLQPRD